MARKRVVYDIEQFFVFLNSKDDLTAIIHGLSTIEAQMDEAIASALAREGLKGDELLTLRIGQKAVVLTALGMFDAEAHPLLGALAEVRNAFAHRLRDTLQPEEGVRVWDAMPERARDRSYPRFNRESDARRLVRWAIVLLAIRLQNRAFHGHEADLPYC